jgi:SAM-dependent methyltransferase
MTSPPQPTIIQKLMDVYPSFALLAGMQLDLFTPLKDGPLRAEQIADTTGVRLTKLRPLLYALAAAGLLSVEGDRFSNTDEANHFLVRGSPLCMAREHELYANLWHASLQTAESIRTAQPQARHDYAEMSDEALASFFHSLHPDAVATGQMLAAHYDFSSYRTLLDLGGGSGGLAIAVAEICPHIQATVVDLPTVTPITHRFVTSAGVADRIKIVAANPVEQVIDGRFDVAVLKAFIQVLSPEAAHCALKNISAAIAPGGSIYILGSGILDNSRTSPPELATFNIIFLNLYDAGQAYTEGEYFDLLVEAGFAGCKRDTLSDGSAVVMARKPG